MQTMLLTLQGQLPMVSACQQSRTTLSRRQDLGETQTSQSDGRKVTTLLLQQKSVYTRLSAEFRLQLGYVLCVPWGYKYKYDARSLLPIIVRDSMSTDRSQWSTQLSTTMQL